MQYSILAIDKGDYLYNLGLKNNLEEIFLGNSAGEWIIDGSEFEDNNLRFLNHFHNPLLLWPEAGLSDYVNGESSLVFSHNSSNEFSWQNARQYFYDALTLSTKESREENFAKMFETQLDYIDFY
jgi:hypothetical protein